MATSAVATASMSTVPTGVRSPSAELYNTQYTYTVSRIGDVDVNSGVYNDSYGIHNDYWFSKSL